MSNKPSIPKGTRDFSPIEMVRRNYIFDVIKKSFKKYGFQQIETPAMENLSTLTGKYGDEGDRLIFKIMPRGEKLKKVIKAVNHTINIVNSTGSTLNVDNISEGLIDLIAKESCEEALRYDLTVPFARYVVQNQNDITFPFRRFQIQPVWRADRPQKGRYREFYQCDADIIGSDSLLNEVDLIKIIDEVFTLLFKRNLNYTISINNRKILTGITEVIGEPDKIIAITVAIDKLDKIGIDKVLEELRENKISETALNLLKPLFNLKGSNEEKIMFLDGYLSSSPIGKKGVEELSILLNYINQLGLNTANIQFDVTLARGLNYYTGTIIEVKVENFPSITGGGRYDDLTGTFGLKNVSGVGISFGADRIYDVLLDNNLYPEFKGDSTQVLFTNQSAADEVRFLPMLFELRDRGINAELYTEQAKWQKQMIFAEKKGIQFIVSANEKGETFVKNTNEEEKKPFSTIEEIISFIQNRKS
jgi:histidyl-tRNA synthetase